MNLQRQTTLSQSEGCQCETCDGIFFEQVLLIRRTSKLLTGDPQDRIDLVPVFRCTDCKDILKEFFPTGMSDVEEILGLNKQEELATKPSSLIL